MAGPNLKKRTHQDFTASKRKPQQPSKKQRRQAQLAYNSDSSKGEGSNGGENFKPVNLLDSDGEDLDNVAADDGGASDSGSDSGSDSEDSDASTSRQKLKRRKPTPAKAMAKPKPAAQSSDEEDDDEEEAEDESDANSSDAGEVGAAPGRKKKSKRNDPNAFATSLNKILSTKLSITRRSDPVLSRSADARLASKQAVDAALEAKARRQMRAQKLAALEKGRVKDVLVASRNEFTGEAEATTAEILEQERRLRKLANRGVLKLFNAVRQAQVRGQEAERKAKKEGFVGVMGREKVNEMSRKGFLDLVASGGGGLKKGALEG